MKKFVLILILSLSIMAVFAGCNKKTNEDSDSNNNIEATPTPVPTDDTDNTDEGEVTDKFVPIENPVVKEDYDYNDYIKIGQYKGVEVKVEKLTVTEENLEIAIQMDMHDNGATPIVVTDRAVQLGDTVNIDFVGYHNGEPFSGGSFQGYDLTVGSRQFIDGFEDQLIGAELNTEIEVNVVFPENYGNATLAGEPAVFKVIVNGIQYYEITDDYINNIVGFDSKEEYVENLRSELNAYYTERMISQKENDLYDTIIKNSEITLPDNLVEYYESDLRTLYINVAASYETDLETFIVLSGGTMEAFEADIKEYSRNMATRELFIKAISNAEVIELTEEEFQAKVSEYAEQYGYESNEAFLEEAETDILREDLLFRKIIDFIVAESIEI
jgi:trigger factor